MCYAGFIFSAIPDWPVAFSENQGCQLRKYKYASIMSRAYMYHYIRHSHLLGAIIGKVLRYHIVPKFLYYTHRHIYIYMPIVRPHQ